MKSGAAIAAVCCIGWACVAEGFEITAVEKGGTIRWHVLGGYAYTVESCDDLTDPWEAVPPAGQWPIQATEWLVNGGAGWPAVGRRFYRVVASPAAAPMVLVPGGTNAGTDPDFGAYSLTVVSFAMDKYEVTSAFWDEVKNWNGGNGYVYDNPGSGKAWNHPVHTVNWHDAVKWCNARSQKEGRTAVYYADAGLTQIYKTDRISPHVNPSANGYRLPTDVEWHYAARGGVASRRFPWGDSNNISHDRANYWAGAFFSYDESYPAGFHPDFINTGSYPFTSPVGSFAANGYGLCDMAGNVWEWCYDWRPGNEDVYRTIRGGTWADSADKCRVSYRSGYSPDLASNHLGFRCVRLPGEP